MILKRILHDYLTSVDGETYAIGRGLGLVLFFVGLGIAVYAIWHSPTVEMVSALAVYMPAWAGGVTLLIWGTKTTEPAESKTTGVAE